jgi:hypothetical protein
VDSRAGMDVCGEQEISLLCVPCSVHSSDFIKFSKRPTNALELMNVFLLRSNHRHVSATHATDLRAVPTRILL